MPAFDVHEAMLGMIALIDTIPAIERVQIGAPESPEYRIEAWVTIGDPDVIEPERAGSVYKLPINLICWFGYSVERSETAAEAMLADVVSDFTRRVIQNRSRTVDGVTRNLNGSVDRMGLPHAAVGGADYTMMAGAEFRLYPLGVLVTQIESIPV
jgi:hypothetical protein